MVLECELDLSYSKAQIEVFFPESNFPKFTVVRKGRRVGLTRGAAQAFIEYGLDETIWFLPKGDIFLMWADTVSGNIDRYYERYFQPILKTLPDDLWSWELTKRILKIGRATIDFRSADRPENWEGFGYHMIFLNEAGIILEDDYLYDNAVLPMLMDYPNTKLMAAGVPKGRHNKHGVHKFFKIYEESLKDKVNYRSLHYTSYSNPFIDKEAIDLLASTYDELNRKQEIEGEFVDFSDSPFLYAFKREKHIVPRGTYIPNEKVMIYFSFDFNVNPSTCVIGQSLRENHLAVFDEIEVSNGSTEQVCEELLVRYRTWINRGMFLVAGDASGANRSSQQRGNITHYAVIKRMLNAKNHYFKVPNANMSHSASRVLFNSVLTHSDFSIFDGNTAKDLASASVDNQSRLIKNATTKGLHLFDCACYLVGAHYSNFILKNL